MRIDLHTHSNVSDGTDTPAGLVRAAKTAGLDVVRVILAGPTGGWVNGQVVRVNGGFA